MSKDFDPDWPHGHVTRAGRKARILSEIAGKAPYAYAAAYIDRDGYEHASTFTADGCFWADSISDDDLLNAPAPKRKFVGWLNFYGDNSIGGHIHETREGALASAHRCSLRACVRVEFEEGDGL
jgi:hypothetical protein